LFIFQKIQTIRSKYKHNSSARCAVAIVLRFGKYYVCSVGNMTNLKIWLVYVLPILHFPLHAIPVCGVHITTQAGDGQLACAMLPPAQADTTCRPKLMSLEGQDYAFAGMRFPR
jgi:hypothetical protein